MKASVTPNAILTATVSLLESLCTVSSATGHVAGLGQAMALYGDALADRGLRVATLSASDLEIDPAAAAKSAGETMLLASRRGSQPLDVAQKPGSLMLIGHLDTVLPARPPKREGERMIATGSADMKGGMAMLIGALMLLETRGQQPPADLLVAVVPDEEILGPFTRQAVRTFGRRARALWSLEPGKRRRQERGEEETVVIGRRGLIDWRLDAVGRAAHAGGSYWHGRSALIAAATWSTRAAARSRSGPGPTVNPARMVAGESAFVRDPCADPSLLGSARQLNVIPNRARVEGEARFRTAALGTTLIAELEALAAEVAREHQVELHFTIEKTVPPLEPSPASRALAAHARTLAARHGIALGVETDRGGLSFPNVLPANSETIAIDGLGPAGDGMHTTSEWVDLVSLDRRITLLAELLAAEHEAPKRAEG